MTATDSVYKNPELIDFDPQGYLIKIEKNNIISTMNEMYAIIHNLSYTSKHFFLSSEIKNRIESYCSSILSFKDQFNTIETHGNQSDIAKSRTDLYRNFQQYYQQEMSLAYNQSRITDKLIVFYTIVKSLTIDDSISMRLGSDYIKENESKIKELLKSSEQYVTDSKSILNELKKKVSETPISDYAQVFEKEHTENKKIADRFLYCGIGVSFLFILSIILFSAFGWFEIVVRNEAGKLLYYNFSNLFTKVVLVAIQVFFISFCFKQYNVNKHLATLNKHRQNALNSYKLFQASIIGNDNGSHNALMLQVAKSIYEHPQSTGFLNENSQQMQSGIVELTKIIGDNKPS